jgi:glutaminyl-peptide cyclotransferase
VRRVALLTALWWALAAISAMPALAGAPGFPCSVLRILPHDPSAFTQGLLLRQGELYESTGLYGQSSLRRVDPESGRVLAQVALGAKFFAEGLALCPGAAGADGGERLVQLTWKEGRMFTYDPETLRQTGSYRLRGEGWGLTCGQGPAGSFLVLSDGSDTLRLLDPRTLAETGTLRVRDGALPVPRLNELEWHNGWVLANIWGEDRVALIRGDTGQVAAWLDISSLRAHLKNPGAEAANGIAVDRSGRRIYLTGKRWDAVFVLEMPHLLMRPPGHQP